MASNLFRQLKYIVGGAALAFFLDMRQELEGLWQTPGWPSVILLITLGITLTTVSIFLYLLVYLPRVKGVLPDYNEWRTSSNLSKVVPLLTTTILSGWALLLTSLTVWSRLNFIQSLGGSVGLYAMMFGLIGLIPTPMHQPVKVRD